MDLPAKVETLEATMRRDLCLPIVVTLSDSRRISQRHLPPAHQGRRFVLQQVGTIDGSDESDGAEWFILKPATCELLVNTTKKVCILFL